jgi:cell wall-associated NlpC family hydrolase
MHPVRAGCLAVEALVLAGALAPIAGCSSSRPSALALVRVSFVDLRSHPHSAALAGVHDAEQETQLLYGETARIIAHRTGWAQIESLEQQEFSHQQRWQGYPGWVPAWTLKPVERPITPSIVVVSRWASLWHKPDTRKSSKLRLPMGSRLAATQEPSGLWRARLLDGSTAWVRPEEVCSLDVINRLSVDQRRTMVLSAAERFLGDPYFWGGRSPHDPALPASGVDCSGLVSLAYRTVNLLLPRDAHEQALRARPVEKPKPGDLVFLSARQDPSKIVHVMLAAKGDELIEAPGTGLSVRRISAAQRLGQSLESLKPGAVVNEQTVTFGAYFPDP